MKTNKLCVIDLASIVESACGAESPESPTDQKLLPGVKEAIDRLKTDGWHLAIVVNVPDCTSKMKASKVRVGDCLVRDGDYYQVEAIDTRVRGEVVFQYDKYLKAGHRHEWLELNDEIVYSEISPKHMVEVVQFAADLCGIEEAYFCPDIEGKVMYSLGKGIEYGWRSMTVSEQDFEYVSGFANPNYRLPDIGMLSYAEGVRIFPVTDRLMIGDHNSIQAAAKAGFKFMTVQELCNGQP